MIAFLTLLWVFLVTPRPLPRHAGGVGHSSRGNSLGGAHRSGVSVQYMVRILAQERALRPLVGAA